MPRSFSSPDSRPLTARELTPGGRGAVATIGLAGELRGLEPWLRCANGKSPAEQPVDQICYALWGTELQEDVVYLRTGENSAEVHCHGGRAAVERILAPFREGAAIGSPSPEGNDLLPAVDAMKQELQAALVAATTQRTAHHLLRQLTLLPNAWHSLSAADPAQRQKRIDQLLRWSEFGRHLTTPWKIVLCGRPNVGKSSLLNALVGFTRSVVFDQPGTTRDVVSVETAFDGWPVELADTAGLRQSDSELEAAGIARARKEMRSADLLLLVLDSAVGLTDPDRRFLDDFPTAVVVWNKADLVASATEPVPPAPDEALRARQTVAVSATTGAGIEQLITTVVQRLVPVEPPAESPFPVTLEQISRLMDMRALLSD
ncbi:GTPase [Planctomicrobium sp. SH664]|uniref:GTPase n=1 Tax=Planctomicrobium sp. SH664 TaxID=3448125 RepID=UPI003F5C72CC